MTERHAFLSAIRESPDDDTPRLVYADWLEEHGEPERAELVRVQIDLRYHRHVCDRSEGDTRHCERCRLLARQRRIPQRPPFDVLPPAISFRMPGFNRGIVELLECTWACWREYGDEIWERELPWKVRLATWPGGSDFKFMGEDIRARWPGIDFELPGVTAADVEAVLAERANA